MPPEEKVIAYCHSCGGAMDVTPVAPYSNVECPTCGQHTRVKHEFGPYTLIRRHAIGGMSVVFLARDNTLGREVAVKILNESYSADERRIEAFEEEARITASLSHPHVVRVFTTGRAFDRFYIAMEWVSGGHFEQRITEQGKVPERDVLPVAIQVAEGLQAAQSAGLIHRDVKPGNILFDAAGNAKIVDFGLALVTQGGVAQAKELWATPYYVPPETVEGQPEDFRSDLYAFGATLYHALAGVPPCQEESMSTTILREAKRKVPPLRSVAPWLSAETCAVVERAMAYDPNARYKSYNEMLTLLRKAQQRALTMPEGGISVRRRRGAERRKRVTLAASAVVLLAALGLGGWLVSRPKQVADLPSPATAGAEPVAVDPQAVAPPPPVAEPTTALRIAKQYRQARSSLEAGDYERALAEFSALRDDPAVQEPTRSWAGIEAVAAAYLDGKSSLAADEAAATVAHLETSQPETSPIREEIMPVLRQLAHFPPAQVDSGAADGAVALVSRMLAGLKNWEAGQMAAAAALFTQAARIVLPQEDEWAGTYLRLAEDYLSDHTLLSSPLFDEFPPSRDETEELISELSEKLPLLKTRGRARFNIRAWQLELAKHARSSAAGPAAPPTAAEILATVEELARECRFPDASQYLKDLSADPEGLTTASLLSLTDSAAAFLAAMEADLSVSSVPSTLELKRGGMVGSLTATTSGSLRGMKQSGEFAEFSWSDFTTESINELYRKLVRTQPDDAEKLRRHESAIAFEWLAGDRDRALGAAERLAQENPAFKARWATIVAGLPG
jgi:eukaryotic-like serine/threonine-protein kinase